MTKYEWEHELRKNIHRLPNDEIARVLDYYDEIFEDNIERGKSELDIIREFGNPADVADKIMSEYDGELLPEDGMVEPFDAPQAARDDCASKPDNYFVGAGTSEDGIHAAENRCNTSEANSAPAPNKSVTVAETDKHNVKVVLFIVLNFITGFAFVIVALALWIVLASFAIAGLGMSAGGLYAFVTSFGVIASAGVGSGLAQLGISIAAFGAGVIFILVCVKLIRSYGAITKKFFKTIFKVNKEERA